MLWKTDWAAAKQTLTDWWNSKALAADVRAPLAKPHLTLRQPTRPIDDRTAWMDVDYRLAVSLYGLANKFCGGVAFPFFSTQCGPGSLGTYLGAVPHYTKGTVWYEPCISDPDTYGPIRFDASNAVYQAEQAIIDRGLAEAKGRFLVALPDIIEGLDTLAAMRGSEDLLMDLVERPAWVHRCLEEITEAYMVAFNLMYAKVRDEDNGNAYSFFDIWGPGKTAKLQCDISCMLSPGMFREFVQPYLRMQCRQIPYCLYHFDGTTALQHLDALLEIDELRAIQWTPQAGKPQPGDPMWFEMYRRIKSAGKSLQLLRIDQDQIRPLLDAIGPEGVFFAITLETQQAAEALLNDLKQYRS